MSTLPNSVSQSMFSRTEQMLTTDILKRRYLFGVDLTDENGNEFPDDTIQFYIDEAVSYWEHKLDIVISPQTFKERYDYRQVDYMNFNFLQLKKRPILEVELVKASFPSNKDLVQYPKEWYTIEKESGQLQLTPVEGTFNGLIITNGGSYMPLLYGTRDSWPHLFEITYKAGFCDDNIPNIINAMIGMQASIAIFEILGDIVLGAGVAGESVSIDGASVSRNLTASAMYSGYSARIESYRKKLEEYADVTRKYYNAIPMVVA